MRKVYKGNPNIGLSFLYNTHLGRIILKPLVKSKFVSHLSGKFMDSSLSKIRISSFVKKNNIDLSIYEKDKFDSFNDFFTRKIKIDGLNSGKQIEKLINKVCNKRGIYTIRDIKMPLAIPSVNICNGEVICFTSCENRKEPLENTIFINDIEIGKAVRASCSYPVVFSPCNYKNIKLIDGGIRENVPWKELKFLGADKIINVVFKENEKEGCDRNLIEVATRSIGLLCNELSGYEMTGAENVIEIKSDKVGLLDMSKIDYLYKLGYKETAKKINKFL